MAIIDLNEITKDYKNTSDDCFLAKIAIKKAILDIKLLRTNEPIEFIKRKSEIIPFDLYINATAKDIISLWGLDFNTIQNEE